MSKVEFYNDLDKELVNLFTVIRDKRDEFLHYLDFSIISREIFNDLVNSDPEKLDPVRRAYRTLYIWKYSFSGRHHSDFDFTFGYASTRPSPPFSGIIDTVKKMHERIQQIFIENLDYKEMIKRNDHEDAFFYVDPPYIVPDVNTKYYQHNMDKEEEHIELRDQLANLTGKFMISIPASDFYKDIYSKFEIKEISVYYSTGTVTKSEGDRPEFIITNYKKPPEPGRKIQKGFL